MRFLIGIVVGIIIATIGVQGVATLAGKGINRIQDLAREAAQ